MSKEIDIHCFVCGKILYFSDDPKSIPGKYEFRNGLSFRFPRKFFCNTHYEEYLRSESPQITEKKELSNKNEVSYTLPAYHLVASSYAEELTEKQIKILAEQKIVESLELNPKKFAELFKKYFPNGKEDFEGGLDELSPQMGFSEINLTEDYLISEAKRLYEKNNPLKEADFFNKDFAKFVSDYFKLIYTAKSVAEKDK